MEYKALSYESRNWLNCVKQTKIHSCLSPVRHKPRILIEYFRLLSVILSTKIAVNLCRFILYYTISDERKSQAV